MWEILLIWIEQGVKHILDLDAYDHLLYIIALSIPFAFSQFRTLAIQITAFTLGHTLALLLAANFNLPIDKNWIEVGILASILLTAVYGIASNVKETYSPLHYLLTLIVGCIHGLGFGNFFTQLHPDKGTEFVTSLIGFNLGVEVGQLIIVMVLLIILKGLSLTGVKHQLVTKIVNCAIVLASLYLLYQFIYGN